MGLGDQDCQHVGVPALEGMHSRTHVLAAQHGTATHTPESWSPMFAVKLLLPGYH